MGHFNLVEEPWISVIDAEGQTKEVCLQELFQHSHEYAALAGDTKTQDFAVMRVLLAILHTVFSRVDYEGKPYQWIHLESGFRQNEPVEEYAIEEYADDLYDTWFALWDAGHFPDVITEYLLAWKERFFLFDEEYPFFQVRLEDISNGKINKPSASSISGKNINRLISESGNKIAMFSPKTEELKNILCNAEIARWLITFQGYSGLSDKVIFGNEKYKASKGWLFDLGGVYLVGENLFQTLMLNLALTHDEENNLRKIQCPCWELSSAEIIKKYFSSNMVDNIAGLYTAWSRGIYIDPQLEETKPFSFSIVKLPEINHQNKFLEPMTIWRFNETGDNKDTYTPKKHQLDKSMWRSFGSLAVSYDSTAMGGTKKNQRRPGIIDWVTKLKEDIDTPLYHIVSAVSMQDDGNATSWVPTDEIIDSLTLNDFILTELQDNGWTWRVHEAVENTRRIVEFVYKNYIKDIKEIRNIESDLFVNQKVEELYFLIDGNFRAWLAGIHYDDEKDHKVMKWRETLKELVLFQARKIMDEGTTRDYLGIVSGERIKNIATTYNSFIGQLYKNLQIKEEQDGK